MHGIKDFVTTDNVLKISGKLNNQRIIEECHQYVIL